MQMEAMTMNRMLPQYSTMKFTDVWDEVGDFATEYKGSGLYITNSKISDDSIATVFYLLYARYGNSPIANRDVNQFKYKVFATIMQYGPTWEKRLDIQKAIRDLNAAQISEGTFTMYNHAMNPSTEPPTDTKTPLTYINDQNTTRYTKGPLDSYAMLLELLDTDVTKEFIDKFKICFKTFVQPERPLIYVSEEDEEDDGN